MKYHRSEQRLLEHPNDAGDPLLRAMRAALEEDPSPARLARLGAQIDAGVAEGRGPRLDDAPRGTGSSAAWLAGAGAAVVALLAAYALLHGAAQPARPIAPPRVSIRSSTATEVPSPAPQLQAPAERAPLASPAPLPRRPRERKAHTLEHARALGPDDELDLLRSAQHALPRDGQAALQLVREHERAYPHGVLEQERELLAIAALLSLDEQESAQRRAQAFRHTFPHSIHLRRLDRMLAQEGRGAAAIGNRAAAGTLTP